MAELPVMSPKQLHEVFYSALHNHDLEKVKFLVESYRPNLNDVHAKPYSPLIFAVNEEDLPMVEYLVSVGADVNLIMSNPSYPNADTAFMMALHRDCGDIALFLLEKNADHTRLDVEGNNALLKALKTNNWRLIRFLLGHNKYCDPKAINCFGESFFSMILTIRTQLSETLPLNLLGPAMWVHQHPNLVNKILLWSNEKIL